MTGYLPLDWCIFNKILKWTCTKQWRCSYLLRHEGQILNNFKKFLSIKVTKNVLDSVLYETLKWPQITSFCISSKKKIPDPLPLSRIMACTQLSLSYAPDSLFCLWVVSPLQCQSSMAYACFYSFFYIYICHICY